MHPDPWERWSPLGGIVFAVLFLAALGTSSGGARDTPAEITRYYAEGGNRNKEILAFFLLVAAVLAFLWFLGSLRSVLVRADGESARWTALGFGAGVTSAALMLAAAAVAVAPAFAAGDDDFSLDPNTAQVLSRVAYSLVVGAAMTGALLVVATAIVSLRTPVMPRWSSLASFVLAAALLFSIFFFPLLVWPGWILAVSLILILRSARVAGWRKPI